MEGIIVLQQFRGFGFYDATLKKLLHLAMEHCPPSEGVAWVFSFRSVLEEDIIWDASIEDNRRVKGKLAKRARDVVMAHHRSADFGRVGDSNSFCFAADGSHPSYSLDLKDDVDPPRLDFLRDLEDLTEKERFVETLPLWESRLNVLRSFVDVLTRESLLSWS